VELGNHDRALELYSNMLAVLKKELDPQDVWLSIAYVVMGEAQRRAGRDDEAERTLQQAIAHNSRVGIPEHPLTGDALTYLGLLHIGRRSYNQALRECRRALKILLRDLDEHSSVLLTPRACIGEALIGVGELAAARKELEAAVSSIKADDTGPQRAADVRFQLARALWATPNDRRRALELARATLRSLATAEGDNSEMRTRIERWLGAHGDRRSR
jgi:tetratricopeptide (TPR) repeat protein